MNAKYRTLQVYILWALDMACIIVSYMLASFIRYNSKADYGDKTLHYLVSVIFLLVATVYTFMADWNRDFIVRGWFQELLNVVRFVAVISLVSLVAVFFLQWYEILSRLVIFNFVWIETLLTLAVRITFKEFFKKHLTSEKNVTNVVVVAEKPLIEETINNLMNRRDSVGYKVVRAYSVDVNGSGENADSKNEPWYVGDVHVHKGIHNLTERLLTDSFDEVFINTPNIPQSNMKEIILGFEEMGISTHYNLELPGISKAHTQFDDYMGYSVITYCMNRTSYKRLFIKRFIDVIGGFVGLVLTGVITLFLAPAIKLDSPGPVFFSQTRIGKNGRRFKIYKFRSMYIDAEERLKDLQDQNEMNGLMFKMENDPRITKVGEFIRKTSLDEFPQFLNVLKGDMSLVGTRPPTESEFEQYNEHYRRRLSMTPGLTGLWQISGRSDIQDFDEVVRLDLQYIDNWSLTEDIRILLKTVYVVLFGKGAK
ncbi:Undecaprenyl-phosphate galactose phosphotransferase, WbaP/exopolysaccharide biosynthesis polyprenyl glycosylphosphotransferase [Butyrivibrio proteoclasticus]|uniref:Undecaprenyl-phosphate galactose phosphotransferase, WbaP/exopolysaccharide biosynthesis polyprenyl glycosylphosphotransferase n=1 Tax=Butyrivibrio proteoclasticus TaxID=43305 RepID=A0A1I5VN98_9FIRM|nr:sugar transferase [Butyrivibrio proteoclasticus]SFQ08456.1 Undecaprenyl-phosphate galactose phosphotransferase, WbaP/exopolysaccharide biosynthesis polyprenyl glycosylphosphotransferase [Butyrivibrio proteoclasticus]